MSDLGDRIQERLAALDDPGVPWLARRVSEDAGKRLPEGTLYTWLKQDTEPKIEPKIISALSRVLQCEPLWLMFGEGASAERVGIWKRLEVIEEALEQLELLRYQFDELKKDLSKFKE